jgi:predicted secreted protein
VWPGQTLAVPRLQPRPTVLRLEKNLMKNTTAWMLALVLGSGAPAVSAQNVTFPPPQNVLQLAATGSVEVQQDLLSLQLSTTREGADPTAVQAQLKQALEAALAEARKSALPGQMDIRTGNFSLYPRHGRDGKISAWNGTVELVLEGRDFPRITQTAGRIQTLTLRGTSFGLSREERARVEREAQAAAIASFKQKASELASGFGFGGYALREVSVMANDQGFEPRPRMMAMEARSAAVDAPVPVEPGKSTVVVTVSGSVQLR